ncbi:MAG: helix-turn-helix domain-containing protein [Lactobacillus sp.]|nr:helix-turn-helix domain-containing protein [Lactobacillus sp.]
MNNELLNKFKKLNSIEKKQYNEHLFINDFHDKTLLQTPNRQYTPIFTAEFFKDADIYVAKHNRFAPYPKHTHTFLEINYILSGTAKEKVNGETIYLNKGDILLLGVGTTHAISTLEKNDILINISFRNSISCPKENLRTSEQSKNMLFNLIFANNNANNCMVYRKKYTEPAIRNMANLIIEEYYYRTESSDKLIGSYLNSLLILLSRNTNIPSDKFLKENTPAIILYILKEISANSANISLTSIAKKTNYSRSYLGNLFKETVGKSFSAALTEQRLLNAYNLLKSTNLSISEIIQKVGISNKTFFYQKFKKKFNCLPSKIR